MDHDEYFSKVIEGFLFHDLKNMAQYPPQEILEKDDGLGAMSYPIIATVCHSMELLGGLLYAGDYQKNGMAKCYFLHYYQGYLAEARPIYKGYDKLFWVQVRNGVAHSYAPNAAVDITKGDPAKHLKPDNNGKHISIDCLELYRDFLYSYDQLVKPKLADGALTKKIQENVKRLLVEDKIEIPNTALLSDLDSERKTTEPSIFTTSSSIRADAVQPKMNSFKKQIQDSTFAQANASTLRQEQAEQLDKQLNDDRPLDLDDAEPESEVDTKPAK